MNYKLLHNLENLNKFIDFLPNLKDNESYFLMIIARKKWFESNIPSALKLKRESVQKELIVRTIKQWESELGTYQTREGVSIPNENIGIYIAYNPKNQYLAASELAKECMTTLQSGRKNINVKSMANDVIQSANGSRNFMDIDVDVKEGEDYLEIVNFIKSNVNEKYLTFVKTNGGFHCLINLVKDGVQTTKLPDFDLTPKKNWHQTIRGHNFKSELNIMSHDLMPLVGCNQGTFVPYQF